MLLGNYTPLSANPGRCVTHAIPNPYKWRSSGNMYSFYTGDAVVSGETEKSSFNNGYIPPYSWILSPKAGGIASIGEVSGIGELTGSASKGINVLSDMSGSGLISNGSLSMVVSMLADLVGSGTLTAGMVGVIQIVANLIGQGSVTAGLSLLANMIVDMTSQGTVSSDLRGKSSMAADIYVNQAEASIQQMVYAVWNAIATEFNNAGTMGEKLNASGTAGDPWTADLSNYTTPGTAGKKLNDQKNPSLLIDNEIIV